MVLNNLAVFDFDWSLIEEDSDHWAIHGLSPEQWELCLGQKGRVSVDIMDEAICKLQDQGITKSQFVKVLQTIPMTSAMIDTLKRLNANKTRVIIVSDANPFYIETILETYNVRNLVTDIITNTLYTDSQGRFRVGRRTPASGLQHNCPQGCSANLCKGMELSRYIDAHGPFEKVMYVGDGRNDYCPCTYLRDTDRVFARSGRTLSSLLAPGSEHAEKVKANITFWETSETVLDKVCKEGL
ncbi:phosphatase phospho-type [Phycomyces nitens]|nr:phosphatase phospho-type [Phycomyces nitens]